MVDKYKDDEAFKQVPEGFLYYLSVNFQNADLANANIRQAVSLSINRNDLCEKILKDEIIRKLKEWNPADKIMFKFTIPTVANHYLDLYDYDCVVRIVALSGGYEIDEACELLAKNNRMIASFSRALLQDLNAHQTQEEFDTALNNAIVKIYNASID